MSRKLFSVFALLIVLSMVLAACGGAATEAPAEEAAAEETVAEEPAEEVAAEDPGTTEGPAPAQGGDTLGIVRDRGLLKCGISGALVGFSYVQADGSLVGFDWDFCRAIAAAALGDAEAVEGRTATSSERFPILQSGEIDVLVRNTTWTLSRDTSLGFNFAPVTFYDGQGMMVRKDSGFTTLEDLEGGTVCVGAGTTTEKNLASSFRLLDINYEPVVFTESNAPQEAFESGRCDGWTTDKSGLVSNQTIFAHPEDFTILEDTMSKEPLAPAVRHGDDTWFDIVKWTVNCTFLGEELGVNQANVDEMLGSDDPSILNLLGVEGDLGQAMGLNNDFCYQIIKQVGNYEDIYNANLGPDTVVNLVRGANSQWYDGGLLYSPPFK